MEGRRQLARAANRCIIVDAEARRPAGATQRREATMSRKRVEGRVKWFDPERGYGFISRQGGSDVYVHIRELWQAGLEDLEPGQLVTFTIRTNEKGPRAQEIAPVEKAGLGGSELSTTETDFTIDANYLAEGYFQDDEREYVRPQVLDEIAIDVAKVLGTAEPATPPGQLRRFLDRAQAIETKLDRGANFGDLRADIAALKSDAAYLAEEGLVPDVFHAFIARNAVLGAEDEHSFRDGFLPHLESVLAYFGYFFPGGGEPGREEEAIW
jgi:CspA family cold shock protein